MAAPDGKIQQRRVAVIKTRQHARARQACRIKGAVFPKMDLREIAEARFVEGREQRMFKIQLR